MANPPTPRHSTRTISPTTRADKTVCLVANPDSVQVGGPLSYTLGLYQVGFSAVSSKANRKNYLTADSCQCVVGGVSQRGGGQWFDAEREKSTLPFCAL